MKCPELSICVDELLGIPRVSMRGSMSGWHDQAVGGIIEGLSEQGVSSIVLDLAGLDLVGTGGADALVEILHSFPPELCVHIVARMRTRNKLCRGGFAKNIRLYSSIDEMTEYLSDLRLGSSGSIISSDDEDGELPVAA